MKRTFINRLTSEMASYGIEFWIHVVFTVVICLLAAIVLHLCGVGHEATGMIAGGEWSLMDIIGDFWGAVLFMLCHFV